MIAPKSMLLSLSKSKSNRWSLLITLFLNIISGLKIINRQFELKSAENQQKTLDFLLIAPKTMLLPLSKSKSNHWSLFVI